jgi:hypothetical protein
VPINEQAFARGREAAGPAAPGRTEEKEAACLA